MQAEGTVARPWPYFSGGPWSELCQLCLSPRRQIKNSKCSSILFYFPPPSSPRLFSFFLFSSPSLSLSFCQCRIQGHCQKHIPHNPTSDGDSFPTACVSENSEIIPMLQWRVPRCSSGASRTLALVCCFYSCDRSVFSAGHHSARIQHCMSLHIWFIRSKCVHVPRKCSFSLCILYVTEKIKI